jgi:hypothetical protein
VKPRESILSSAALVCGFITARPTTTVNEHDNRMNASIKEIEVSDLRFRDAILDVLVDGPVRTHDG